MGMKRGTTGVRRPEAKPEHPGAAVQPRPLLHGAETPDFSSTSYQRVHEHLREQIISGRLQAGTRLKIADIAKDYEISQMPVREALQQLQGEGLVVIAPNKGATVRSMDATFVSNIFEIRIALETHLTRVAAERLTAPEIEALAAIQKRIDDAAGQGDLRTHVALNIEFHRRILESTRNWEAIRLLDLHGNLIGALRIRFGFKPQRLRTICREHHALLAALRRQDADAAAAIHDLHIRSARDDLLAVMQGAKTAAAE